MEFAAVVVDDYFWLCLKTNQENSKWVLGRFMRPYHFKSTADPMGAIDGENARDHQAKSKSTTIHLVKSLHLSL